MSRRSRRRSVSRRARVAALGIVLGCALAPIGPQLGAAAVEPVRSSAACANVPYADARRGAGPDPTTPPNPDGPTRVAMEIFVTQLRGLDAVRGEYEFHGHVRATWCDPRLAFGDDRPGTPPRVYMAEAAENRLDEVWWPSAYPINRAGGAEYDRRVLRVEADGTVHSDLNVRVSLNTHFNLRPFPFDHQQLEFHVESVRWAKDELVLVAERSPLGFAADFSMEQWEIGEVTSEVSEVRNVRSTVPFSRLSIEVDVRRLPGFYLWKVLFPVLIIVLLTWSVFWMTDEKLLGRSRSTATGVLTLVAYQFVVAGDLPRIAYLTVLDRLMILSLVALTFTLVQSMVVTHYFRSNPQLALRVDRASRWGFPLGYGLLSLLILSLG